MVFADQIPRCTSCNELVKPDITFFGEQLPKRFYDCVMADFEACDLLIVIGTAIALFTLYSSLVQGTSLQVQPFASLITFVGKTAPRLLINREKVARYNPLMALLGGPVDGFLFDEAYVCTIVADPLLRSQWAGALQGQLPRCVRGWRHSRGHTAADPAPRLGGGA